MPKYQIEVNKKFKEAFIDGKDEHLYKLSESEIEQNEKELKKLKKDSIKNGTVDKLDIYSKESYQILLDGAISTAVMSIIELSQNSKNESIRLRASQYLLDRKYGTPSNESATEANPFQGLPQIIITEDTLKQLEENDGKEK